MLSRLFLTSRSSNLAKWASIPSQATQEGLFPARLLPDQLQAHHGHPGMDVWGGRRMEHSKIVMQKAAERFLQPAEKPEVICFCVGTVIGALIRSTVTQNQM